MATSILPAAMATDPFDDAAIERLKLAAEEVAWLTGRGYSVADVEALVARQHALTDAHRAALACGTCSEPQYRRRAAREIEAEEVPRTKAPLAIDAVDVIACIEAALEGRPVLATLDGTVRAFGIARSGYAPGPKADEAIDRVLAAAKQLRPKGLRFVVDVAATALRDRIEARVKAAKAKAEIAAVADARAALKKERQVVSGDADVLDAAAGWLNLVGTILAAIPNAKIVRLQ